VFGITGFGSAIIAVPLLIQVFPLKLVTPTVTLLEITASLLFGIRNSSNADKSELIRFLPYMALGVLSGAFVFRFAPTGILLLILGSFVTTVGVDILYRSGNPLPKKLTIKIINPVGRATFGIVAGTLATLFNTGGVIIAFYLTQKIKDPSHFRATMSIAVLLLTALVTLLMTFSGYYFTEESLCLYLFLIPAMLTGVALGSYAFKHVNSKSFTRVYALLLLTSGFGILVRGGFNL